MTRGNWAICLVAAVLTYAPVRTQAQCSPEWLPELGGGIDSTVMALTVHDGALIAGGFFTSAGAVSANRIARWDGAAWAPLGAGVAGGSLPGGQYTAVLALAVYNGALIAGGDFTSAGSVSANYIASWDGAAWSPLGDGVDGYVNGLEVYNGTLVAAGSFFSAGGVTARAVASWDGAAWSPLGNGVPTGYGSHYGNVQALAVHNGNLIAGTAVQHLGPGFHQAQFARWDSSTWTAIGFITVYPPFGSPVRVTLTVHDGSLIAGGFQGPLVSACMCNFVYIKRHDGSSWVPLGNEGMDGSVRALASYDGALIAGGTFRHTGGVKVNGIARWDGDSWVPLGTGVGSPPPATGSVYALATQERNMVAGGYFTTAGGHVSRSLARWGCPCHADCNRDNQLTIADFGCFQTRFVAGDPYADCNHNGSLTIADFGCFQTAFVQGCP